jgi:hypothetical protein
VREFDVIDKLEDWACPVLNLWFPNLNSSQETDP